MLTNPRHPLGRLTDLRAVAGNRMAKLGKAVVLQTRLAALDLGLSGGRSDIRRFIILGQGRSGSNFLRGLLNSHGHVLVFSELFRATGEIDWGLPLWRTGPDAIALAATQPLRFLEEHVYRSYPPPVAAVGFKLLYPHARDDVRAHLWPGLAAMQDLCVVHLHRRNLLRSLVSLRRAESTGRWTGRVPPEGYVPTRLSYDECVTYFQQARAWQEQHAELFASRPLLDLVYEDLIDDPVTQHVRLQRFLGLEPRRLSPITVQQSRQRLEVAIENYSELAHRLTGTPWQTFLDE